MHILATPGMIYGGWSPLPGMRALGLKFLHSGGMRLYPASEILSLTTLPENYQRDITGETAWQSECMRWQLIMHASGVFIFNSLLKLCAYRAHSVCCNTAITSA